MTTTLNAPSSAVALLELLAASAPAGVVAADLVAIGGHALLGCDGAATAEAAGAHTTAQCANRRTAHTGRGDRVRARQRLVLVRVGPVVLFKRVPQIFGLVRLDPGVEQEVQRPLRGSGDRAPENMPWPSERYSTSGSFWANERRWTPSRR